MTGTGISIAMVFILIGVVFLSMDKTRKDAHKNKNNDSNIEWYGSDVELKRKHYPEQDFHKHDDFRYTIKDKDKK